MGSLLNRGTKNHPEWYVVFKDIDGKWKRKHSKQADKEQARVFLRDTEARVKRGLQGVVEPTAEDYALRRLTVADLMARFVGEVEDVPGYAPPRIKSLGKYRHDARKNLGARLPPTFLQRPAASVRLADIEAIRDQLSARGLAGASVVQVLATLSKLYNWSRKVGLVDCANPVSGVERPRVASSLDYLDKGEVGRLLQLAEDRAARPGASWEARTLAAMAAVAIYTGLRKGELLGLRWRDVNIEAARIDVLRSYELLPKSGKARHVPVPPELLPILRAWHKGGPKHEDLVFPVEAEPAAWRMGDAGDMFGIADALVAAECHEAADGHPWHMLRHTYASHFVMGGGNLLTLQRLLGHSTPIMTQRYAHLAPDFLAAEVARVSFARPPKAADVVDLNTARRAKVTE